MFQVDHTGSAGFRSSVGAVTAFPERTCAGRNLWGYEMVGAHTRTVHLLAVMSYNKDCPISSRRTGMNS